MEKVNTKASASFYGGFCIDFIVHFTLTLFDSKTITAAKIFS